ncbi:hypothetical protein Zmor_009676 [Zophobas morio]|uniref:Uncharacterized protein n=1 Tax=Zophobas morio TaxID=2755281 RepID=A0AA38IJG3_9CUCU|nr:hypothetical protein Zmor_009676 [Zophobas morio]
MSNAITGALRISRHLLPCIKRKNRARGQEMSHLRRKTKHIRPDPDFQIPGRYPAIWQQAPRWRCIFRIVEKKQPLQSRTADRPRKFDRHKGFVPRENILRS